jgi:multisubunit Na+/H+ antiporter MnhB subunit
MPQAERLFGTLIAILFVLFLSPLILALTFIAPPSTYPSLPMSIFEIFWGYRWYDILFLVLVILAAVAGLSSLFRVGKSEVPIEETAIEGYIEEEIEEEE